MSFADRDKSPREIEQLTTSIREMANRVGAQFVLDSRKAESYRAASEQRQSNLAPSDTRNTKVER